MKIECKTTFLDGRERYEAGEVRTVNKYDGRRFITNGWAFFRAELEEPGDLGSTRLGIQNSVIGTGDSNG